MLKRIETLAGEGHITREDGTRIGIRSYRLTVWQQQLDDGLGGTIPGTRSIEGYVQLIPHEAYQFVTAAAPLILELEDGRTLPFSFIDHNGQIAARGALTAGRPEPSRDSRPLSRPTTETLPRAGLDLDFSVEGSRYAEARFVQALHELICGPGDAKARVCKAMTSVVHLGGQMAPFPDASDSRARFEQLLARLTSTPASGIEAAIAASVAVLDDVEVASFVSEFIDLYRLLAIHNATGSAES
jgi:hypothetical protein